MFQSWFKLMAAGADFASAGLRTGEALLAANGVVRDRSRIIADAIHDPVEADYQELGRMIPEKLAAVNAATIDVFPESLKILRDANAYCQAVAGAPWGSGASAFVGMSQPTDLFIRSMGLYAKALKPFHTQVTRNAKRLRKTKKR